MNKREKFLGEMDVNKVFIIPVEVAGYSRGLGEGLTLNGKDVTIIEIIKHRFVDPQEGLTDINHLEVFRETGGFLGLIRWHILRIQASIYLARNADLVISQAAMGLLPFGLDLFLYKLKNIPIVSLCGFGSEARAPQVNHPQTLASNTFYAHLRFALGAIRLRIRLLTHYWVSDFFFASPQISELVPGRFFNFLDLGHPISNDVRAKAAALVSEHRCDEDGPMTTEFRIVHAPSSLSTKGTDLVRQVVNALQSKHKNVSYQEVSNLNHGELLEILGNSDLLIDQAYSDYPLPVTSAEALLCGTPAIVGGYFAAWSSEYYSRFTPPSISSTPECLLENIERLVVQDKSSAMALSRAGTDFVNSNFTSEQVASRLLSCISGDLNSGIARMKRPQEPYRGGLGAESAVIQKYRDNFLSRLVLPELKIHVESPE